MGGSCPVTDLEASRARMEVGTLRSILEKRLPLISGDCKKRSVTAWMEGDCR
jgi:hypothetical protein